jgi:hypothetical protein
MYKAPANKPTQLATHIAVTEKQIEVLARLLLPEIKRFFADENVRREFKQWKQERQNVG